MPKAKKEGPNGIDRWTNNGYGLTVEIPEKNKQAAKEIMKQMMAQKSKGKR